MNWINLSNSFLPYYWTNFIQSFCEVYHKHTFQKFSLIKKTYVDQKFKKSHVLPIFFDEWKHSSSPLKINLPIKKLICFRSVNIGERVSWLFISIPTGALPLFCLVFVEFFWFWIIVRFNGCKIKRFRHLWNFVVDKINFIMTSFSGSYILLINKLEKESTRSFLLVLYTTLISGSERYTMKILYINLNISNSNCLTNDMTSTRKTTNANK